MFEKVNPAHPDKIADRIAGALVDLAYKSERNPRIAVELLIGHGTCHIIAETSVQLSIDDVTAAVHRIAGFLNVDYSEVPQDVHLSRNQSGAIRCGDNGIFKGVPVTAEQKELVSVATDIYNAYPFDGKYIIDNGRVIICQSNAKADHLREIYPAAEINPLGDWTGGTDVDTGATNRKLGSDMADSVTGGGLHGKDLSKADVSVNIYAFLKAQETGKPVQFCCAIGDETVGGIPYEEIVETARAYIKSVGGFEAFADAGFYLSGCCIWKKQSLVLGRSPYQWQHEPCLYGWKKNGKHQWYTGRKETTIWKFDKPKKNSDHPTMKPIPLLAYPIMNSSMSNSVVLDPFGGSGSTLIACEQTDRICYTVELDEKFCDVIVKRYIEQVGGADGVTVQRDGLTYKYSEVEVQHE